MNDGRDLSWLVDPDDMREESFHESSNRNLLARLPSDQMERVFGNPLCDIAPDFLGFVGIYERLSEIVPLGWTVIDLGCACAAQAFFFEKHAKYIGVDLLTPVNHRFRAGNTFHFHGTIAQFLEERSAPAEWLDTTFAICSYVPPWHGDNLKLTRAAFKNVFTFYPAHTGRRDKP